LSSGEIRTFDITSTDASKAESSKLEPTAGPIAALAFLPDSQNLLSAGADQDIRRWSLGGTRAPQVLSGHSGPVYSVAWSPDGKLAATGAGDKTARIWDVAKGAQLRQINAHTNVAYAVA